MYPVRSARVGAVKHGRKSILVNDHRNTALLATALSIASLTPVRSLIWVVKESCLPLVSVTELRYRSRPMVNYSHGHALHSRRLYELLLEGLRLIRRRKVSGYDHCRISIYLCHSYTIKCFDIMSESIGPIMYQWHSPKYFMFSDSFRMLMMSLIKARLASLGLVPFRGASRCCNPVRHPTTLSSSCSGSHLISSTGSLCTRGRGSVPLKVSAQAS